MHTCIYNVIENRYKYTNVGNYYKMVHIGELYMKARHILLALLLKGAAAEYRIEHSQLCNIYMEGITFIRCCTYHTV